MSRAVNVTRVNKGAVSLSVTHAGELATPTATQCAGRHSARVSDGERWLARDALQISRQMWRGSDNPNELAS